MIDLQPNQIQPVGKVVFAKALKEEGVTKSGVILPNQNEKPFMSEVIAVGDQSQELKDIKAGDKVVHKRWNSNEIKLGDDLYYFLAYDEILAVIK